MTLLSTVARTTVIMAIGKTEPGKEWGRMSSQPNNCLVSTLSFLRFDTRPIWIRALLVRIREGQLSCRRS
jgi:hypothetical protein